ncbi:hypothetical protein QTG54_014062 [Skeletonema marinoi]|uniref:Uncharacterized protein n=1 Tax=Skeletonema marinoi TaxID=267567 RepID=A0AAD9D7B2_9STRA|nr:hypothetical protein QTG54_014062 [Skeletonema marinoi]
MVTAIKVAVTKESSSTEGAVDIGVASSFSGVEHTKNDNHPTLKRYYGDPTNNNKSLCNSFESLTESINGGGVTIATAAANNFAGYASYAEIEAVCSGDTTSTIETAVNGTPNSDYFMPYSKIMAESATAGDCGEAAAAAKRPRLEHQASESQNYAMSTEIMNRAQFVVSPVQFVSPAGPGLNDKQLHQQLHPQPVQSFAHQKIKASAPKQKKVQKRKSNPTKPPKSTPKNDATFKRQVQQKQKSAQPKKTSNATAQETNDAADVSLGKYGARGITMRPSKKWQVQYFYHGKSRYIGVFKSKTIALAAYETTREILGGNRHSSLTDEEVNSNLQSARKAVFDALRTEKA